MSTPSGSAPSTIARVGVLTGGGDAPGLNAVIRAVVKSAVNRGCDVVGLEDGFDGLMEPNRWRLLTRRDVTGILRVGGTILGTTNSRNPFADGPRAGATDPAARCLDRFRELKLDALVVIGGDGTLAIGYEFFKRGMPLVGVPKTIDNDIVETTNTFGFDSAVSFATDAIDRLHATAEAHHRVMVVEVMGRDTGWIALYSGMAGGADAILIPEIRFDLEKVATSIREREAVGARFSIVVVAEGARPLDGSLPEMAALQVVRNSGIGAVVTTALERLTGKEVREVVLGHLQRGGPPTSADRLLATRFGARAMELVFAGEFGAMVAFRPPDIVAVPLADVVGRTRLVPLDFDVLRAARAIGVSLGD